MITKEEFKKAVECCASDITDCDDCPLCASDKHRMCSAYLAEYIKKKPAPAVTGTSSEVSTNDTHNLTHLDDSTLLDICQEELEAISEIAINDYPNGYLTGYIVALQNNIKRLRGGDDNG